MTIVAPQQWLATFTRRWHTNPGLCHTADPISARKRTGPQITWHDAWRGKPVAVVCNIREALEAIGIPFRGEIS